MKTSTTKLLNDAMEFNTEVQEDNLNLQELCDSLCNTAEKYKNHVEICNHIKSIETDKDAPAICDEYVAWFRENEPSDSITLGLEQYDSLKPEEKATNLYTRIKVSNDSENNYFSNALLKMIDSSITDLNKKVTYPKVTNIKDIKTVMYNYHAVDNLSTTLSEMLNSICKIGLENLTYQQLRKKFSDLNDLNIAITNTYINTHDYTVMSIPCPKNQTIQNAELTVDKINEMSSMVNHIVSSENMDSLTNIKYSISKRLNTSKLDAIKSIHFISQIVMSIKNSILTLQNYQKALINELM